MRLHYGFAYEDGRSTTTGEGSTLRIAGWLLAFAGAAERDLWADRRDASGKPRDAVAVRKLPRGRSVRMAQCADASHGGDMEPGCEVCETLHARGGQR